MSTDERLAMLFGLANGLFLGALVTNILYLTGVLKIVDTEEQKRVKRLEEDNERMKAELASRPAAKPAPKPSPAPVPAPPPAAPTPVPVSSPTSGEPPLPKGMRKRGET